MVLRKIKEQLKLIVPRPLWQFLRRQYYSLLALKYRVIGRKYVGGETTKAYQRRLREGFFEKYCRGKGLDIGYGGDLINSNARGWDYEHGDAQYLSGVPDASYAFVYSSHTLEHMIDPELALKNWWRVLRPGGYLILYVPHRDLYEKKEQLPSLWNKDHKHFFLIDRDELPDTRGIIPMIKRTLSDYSIVYVKECREGLTITDPNQHSDGEFSIEAVIQRQHTGNRNLQ